MRTKIINFFTIYTQPRIIAIILLGFASGLPLALTLSTLTVWLSEAEVSRTTIGLFAAITTPYALKFLWSPLIDQMPLPYLTKKLGRRRGWMLFTQACLILSIIGLGSTNPAQDAGLTALWALFVAISSASQDIVIDAYRVELLEEAQQGVGAAAIVFGYRIGMLASGAGALYLAEVASWFTTYTVMASLILIGSVTVFITGEPDGTPARAEKEQGISALEKLLHWLRHAVIDPFANFMERRLWLVILLFVILYKFGDAFSGVMTNPFLIEMGFEKSEIADIVKLFGLPATLFGLFLGGSLVSRYGAVRALWIGGFLQMISLLTPLWQLHAGHNVWVLAAVIGAENLSGGVGTAAFVAYISALCNKQFTATQYALLSSLAAFGRTGLSAGSGWMVDQIGWGPFFIVATAVCIPGLALLYILGRRNHLMHG